VKNGMLGEIEQVSPTQMTGRLDTGRLDPGRSVAFDLKDYAQVDHGYAATIHESQGVTVDRTHVLATPGMDRHGAYVALPRHRDSMQLHCGRDEFEDLGKLTPCCRASGPKTWLVTSPSGATSACLRRRGPRTSRSASAACSPGSAGQPSASAGGDGAR
jgi:hypothetical protein